MKYKYKIGILSCWYGQFPWYFPLFVKSIKNNATIDFFIITDNKEVIQDKPENLIIINHYCPTKFY